MLLIYLCYCLAVLVAADTSLAREINSRCTENGDCLDKKTEINSDNESEPFTFFQVTDNLGKKFNVSVMDIKTILSTLTEKHDNYDKIQKDVDFVFRGVIVALALFGVCAAICGLSACIYCCRISIIDNRLKSDVAALAEKLNRECRLKKSIKKTPLKPVSETCNIIDAEAGLFCV